MEYLDPLDEDDADVEELVRLPSPRAPKEEWVEQVEYLDPLDEDDAGVEELAQPPRKSPARQATRPATWQPRTQNPLKLGGAKAQRVTVIGPQVPSPAKSPVLSQRAKGDAESRRERPNKFRQKKYSRLSLIAGLVSFGLIIGVDFHWIPLAPWLILPLAILGLIWGVHGIIREVEPKTIPLSPLFGLILSFLSLPMTFVVLGYVSIP